jgi:hypothetical protein
MDSSRTVIAEARNGLAAGLVNVGQNCGSADGEINGI